MTRRTDITVSMKVKAVLAYYMVENIVFLYFVCKELSAVGSERSFRADTRTALLAYLLMGTFLNMNCFLSLRQGSTELMGSHQRFMMLSPLVNTAYAADLHMVSCSNGHCGDIHGFTTLDLGMVVVLQIIFAVYMHVLFDQSDVTVCDLHKATGVEDAPTSLRPTELPLSPNIDSSKMSIASAPPKLSRQHLFTPSADVRSNSNTNISKRNVVRPGASHDHCGRGVMRLARGFTTYEGVIKNFNAMKGYGFVTMDGHSKDIYFKRTTCSQEIRALGQHMVGTPVEFIVRWMPDGTPQVRAMLIKKHKKASPQKGKAVLFHSKLPESESESMCEEILSLLNKVADQREQ